jgi:hypothetical protein
MAFTLAQTPITTGSVSSTSVTASFSNNNVAGNAILVSSITNDTLATISVSDSQGNTYVQVDTGISSGFFISSFFYAINIKGGANTVTISKSGGASVLGGTAQEWSGISNTSPVDVHNVTTQEASTITSPTVTTAHSNELLIGWGGNFGYGVSAGSGYSNLSECSIVPPGPLYFFAAFIESNTSNTAGSNTATAGTDDIATSVIGIVAFISSGKISDGTVTSKIHPGKGVMNRGRFFQSARSTDYHPHLRNMTLVDTDVVTNDKEVFLQGKNQSDLVTFIDSFVLMAEKVFSEVVSFLDNISELIQLARSYSDSVIAVDSLSRLSGLGFTDTGVILSDNVSKITYVNPIDSVILSDSASEIIQLARTYSDSVMLADSLSRLSGISLLDTNVVVSDNISKVTYYYLSESVVVLDSATEIVQLARSYSDSVVLADSETTTHVNMIGFSDELSFTDVNQAPLGDIGAIYLGATSPGGDEWKVILFTKQTDLVYVEPLSVIDSLLTSMTRKFSDVLSIIDTFSHANAKTESFSDSIVVLDSKNNFVSYSLSDSAIVSDQDTKSTNITIGESFIVSDSMVPFPIETFTELLSAVDSITYSSSYSISDSIIVNDLDIKSTSRSLTDLLDITDLLVSGNNKSFSESIVLLDDIVRSTGVVFGDNVLLLENFYLLSPGNFIDSVNIIGLDYITFLGGRHFNDSVIVTDNSMGILVKGFLEAIGVTDVNKYWNGAIGTTYPAEGEWEQILFSKELLRTVTESIVSSDELIIGSSRRLVDTIVLSEEFSPGAFQSKFFTEVIGLNDTGYSQPWLGGDVGIYTYPGGGILWLPNLYTMILTPGGTPITIPFIYEKIYGDVTDEDIFLTEIRDI